MRRGLALLAALASACGSEPSPPPAPIAPATIVPATVVAATPAPAPTSPLEVHEWGLLDIPLSASRGAVSAVPSCAPAPAPVSHPRPHPTSGFRAPLLYFHLPSGSPPIDVSVRISMPGGAITEHWPIVTPGAPDTVTWNGTVRPEHCAGAAYPTTCAITPCEAIELAGFEAADASCIHVGESDAADLFYAGNVPLSLPLRITREGDAVTLTNDTDEAFPGPSYVVHRADDRAATQLAEIDLQPHTPITLRAAAAVADLRITPFDALRAQHLSADEVAAFTRAWSCALFGGRRDDGSACTSEPQPTNAVLFWLPRARIDAFAPLAIEPAPGHVERAILVRVDLDR